MSATNSYRAALETVRAMIKGRQIEHAIVDMERPEEGLGDFIDRVLSAELENDFAHAAFPELFSRSKTGGDGPHSLADASARAVAILEPVLALIPDGHREIVLARLEEELRQCGPSSRLMTALKQWDEEWGEIARSDSYMAPWDRELAEAIKEAGLDATRGET